MEKCNLDSLVGKTILWKYKDNINLIGKVEGILINCLYVCRKHKGDKSYIVNPNKIISILYEKK